MTDKYLYYVPSPDDDARRNEPYHRMVADGILTYAMSGYDMPTIADWRDATDPEKAWMLRCDDAVTGELLGVGVFTPWSGASWRFDFSAFRSSFQIAADMARGGFAWMFQHAPCKSIVGVCPAPNRHAWRLAQACGFKTLGRIPGACYYARKDRYVDGIFVVVTPETLEAQRN